MKWLVVIDSGRLDTELPALLKEVSAQMVASSDPVPLSDAEVSVEVEGPQDLPARLRAHSAVKGVYPSSDLTLY